MSATLALITFPSAAHVLPISRHTSLALAPINITGPELRTSREFGNLKYLPWPQTPYCVSLHGLVLDQCLVITAIERIRTSPPINALELQRFVQDFANNIKQDYPIPGVIPAYATQSTIDVTTYTKWSIALYEGFTFERLPTVVALAALDELGQQLYSHGPARIDWCIKDREAFTPWVYGEFQLERLRGNILNDSSSNENGGFQTA